jgi:hypothetical protein
MKVAMTTPRDESPESLFRLLSFLLSKEVEIHLKDCTRALKTRSRRTPAPARGGARGPIAERGGGV